MGIVNIWTAEREPAIRLADSLMREGIQVAVYTRNAPGFFVLDVASRLQVGKDAKLEHNPDRRAHSRVPFRVPVEVTRLGV